MKRIRVIVACEESQAVCKAFRERGFEAYSCDIEPCSGGHPEWHFQEDIFQVLAREPRFDLMIAHPPCTFLSNAGACRLYPQAGKLDPVRYKKGLDAKRFFMRCLNILLNMWQLKTRYHLKYSKCLIATKRYNHISLATHTPKKTRLWLRNLPLLVPTNIVAATGPYLPSGTSRKNKEKYGVAQRGDDAKNRSKTCEGIAQAMAEQWGNYLIQNI